MKKLTTCFALIACFLSGCGYGDNWTDVGPCSLEQEEALKELMDLAEEYQAEAEIDHASFWTGEKIDFDLIIQAMRQGTYECGTRVEIDGYAPTSTTNLATGSVVIDPDEHYMGLFNDNFMNRSDVQMYGLQTYQERYERIYWSDDSWNEYGKLLDENHWYYAGPRMPLGYLIHEAVHLAYGEKSLHDYEEGNPPDNVHLTDMAHSVQYAYTELFLEQNKIDYTFLDNSCEEIDHCYPHL